MRSNLQHPPAEPAPRRPAPYDARGLARTQRRACTGNALEAPEAAARNRLDADCEDWGACAPAADWDSECTSVGAATAALDQLVPFSWRRSMLPCAVVLSVTTHRSSLLAMASTSDWSSSVSACLEPATVLCALGAELRHDFARLLVVHEQAAPQVHATDALEPHELDRDARDVAAVKQKRLEVGQ